MTKDLPHIKGIYLVIDIKHATNPDNIRISTTTKSMAVSPNDIPSSRHYTKERC
jgi:hypothetical protein